MNNINLSYEKIKGNKVPSVFYQRSSKPIYTSITIFLFSVHSFTYDSLN